MMPEAEETRGCFCGLLSRDTFPRDIRLEAMGSYGTDRVIAARRAMGVAERAARQAICLVP